jgi:hypothetical protein
LSKSTYWTTKAGTFKTDRKQFILPEFHEGKDISWNMHVNESDARLNSDDMIIGRDLLHELGIDLLFSLGVMKWDNAIVPMRDPSQLRDSNIDDFEDEIFRMHDPTTTDAARIQEIMDQQTGFHRVLVRPLHHTWEARLYPALRREPFGWGSSDSFQLPSCDRLHRVGHQALVCG